MRSTLFRSWVLLLAGLCAPAAWADPAGLVLKGRILAPGGAPLAGAKLALYRMEGDASEALALLDGARPEPVARASSDDRGRYRVEAPGPGHWRLEVQADGFAPMSISMEGVVEPRLLADVTLRRAGTLNVQVKDAEGHPLPRVLVGFDPRRFRWDERWTFRPTWARTDAEGQVTFDAPRGLGGKVVAFAPAHAFVKNRVASGNLLSLTLEAVPGRVLEVRSAAGSPEPGVAVVEAGSRMPLGVTDDRGHLRVPARQGAPLRVEALARDGRRAELRVEAPRPAGERDAPRIVRLPQRWKIVGRVVEAGTSEPLPGALVWADDDVAEGVVTDAEGHYTLYGLPGTRVFLDAVAAAHVSSPVVSVSFRAPESRGPTLALRPAAGVEGIVVDSDGRPVEGAEVFARVGAKASRVHIEYGRRKPGRWSLTDANGRFRLTRLDPEEPSYELHVRARGYAPASRPVSGLEAGRFVRRVRIEVRRGVPVRGTVEDGEGAAVAGATVIVAEAAGDRPVTRAAAFEGGPETVKATTGDDGSFEITDLGPGRYDIWIRATGFAVEEVTGMEIPEGAEETDWGVFTLEPGVSLQGQVLDSGGEPVEGAAVRLTRRTGPSLSISGDEEKPDARTEPDGWFVIRDLRPGTHVGLRASREGFLSADALVAVPPEEPVQLVLVPASRVSGRVVDPEGEGVPRAGVELEATLRIARGDAVMMTLARRRAQADAEGRFEFTGVSPGTVSLIAASPGRIKTRLDGIEVDKGRNAEGVELVLKPGAVLEGRVLLPDGSPAVGVEVHRVEGRSPLSRMRDAVTDGDGFYTLEGLPSGPASIEALHRESPRVVRDIELEPGRNTLNFQLEGGHEVAGHVVDETGAPLSGAWVNLVTGGALRRGPSATSDEDGRFRIRGVPDGTYTVEGSLDGYFQVGEPATVVVQDEPVSGLVVTLRRGGAIAGRVLGVEPDQYAEVAIEARRSEGPGGAHGRVDHEGDYRLDGLEPGTWRVTAFLGNTGRQANGSVRLEPGMDEAVLDLEFERGTVLSGRVVEGDAPVTGARVTADGRDVERSGRARTDDRGAFRIEGLVPGTYRVAVRQMQTGLFHEEAVELNGDRHVVIRVPTQRVAGRVVDAVTRRPLEGATVTLRPRDAERLQELLVSKTVSTDQAGGFRLGRVGPGTWTLTVGREGYGSTSRELLVSRGDDIENLEIRLDPTQGLVLEVRPPSGRPPDTISASVLDGSGLPILQGDYATGEGGRVRLAGVPSGTWTAIVSAPGSASTRARVEASGAVIPFRLEPPCELVVRVPALEGSGTTARATLLGADGTVWRQVGWLGSLRAEWTVRNGRLELTALPPGTWTVRVRAADDRQWEATVTTSPSAPATVTLHGAAQSVGGGSASLPLASRPVLLTVAAFSFWRIPGTRRRAVRSPLSRGSTRGPLSCPGFSPRHSIRGPSNPQYACTRRLILLTPSSGVGHRRS